MDTVISEQPKPPANSWKVGLYDVGNDPAFCVYTYFCSPCAFGSVGSELHQLQNPNDTSSMVWYEDCCATWVGASCCISSRHRRELRDQYDLKEDDDQLASWLCCLCANCQHHNEIRARQGSSSMHPNQLLAHGDENSPR